MGGPPLCFGLVVALSCHKLGIGLRNRGLFVLC